MEPSLVELLGSGVKLMLIGMGIVFLFLMLLVWVIQQTHRIIQRFAPESPPARSESLPARHAAAEDAGDLVAVIAAAIHRYEKE